ncbi:isoleucine--tRNA ligase [uncultured Pseudokineococcus sp.]|uniref:isoleucine--tRNA ligase n=1 Tax=uncultured Pseudokineococcus sp. TaxID=1642928 RepID=UPI00262636FE|nr:isoleucine--tRNA ligase [uncultured Pseudokineococcus sp.]
MTTAEATGPDESTGPGESTGTPASARGVYPLASAGRTGAGGGVPALPSLPDLERRVLDHWAEDGTFRASVEQRPAGEDGANEYVFYDGPPFANGLPHYGHLLTGYVKDVVPRYQTMRGRRVERRFGWDCHGLPAELEAERQLGIGGKRDVLEMGIEVFNEACRSSVLRYTDEWQEYVTRQARWVDFDHDYKTLDLSYMESVMWAFKTLHDKGLVYEGQRVLPYCWRDETPLSNHELRMDDDVYQQRQDPAVTVWFGLETGERLLAWTTTPWTLPSNLAAAVGPDVDYVVVEAGPGAADGGGGERYVLAEARLASYAEALDLGDDPAARVVRRLRGTDLVGRRYAPLFDYLSDADVFGTERAFVVVPSDHVTTEDGTGVVHMAPAYGEDDQRVCAEHGIPVVLTVDDRARFTSVVPDFEGQHVFEANTPITRALRERGRVLRADSYVHSYPHCWRCRNPLIYRAVSSWFVEVTKVRDRMVELNQQVEWVPGHVKDGQFGKWLQGARDWSISRNRFWGSPLPVWVSDDPAHPRTDVYGSLDELERDFGVRPTDLHRPFVDELTRPNPDDPTGRSTMRRVPDVLDVWFDSGSMPFAQVHAPFEDGEWFDSHFPGDFVVEYIGQTRGWFYTMHVLATALFDRPAFRRVVSHGIVLGDDGQKMSKSLRNYPDVGEVFARDGSDAMRWFLMASPVLRGGNLVVTEAGIREGVRAVLLPLWNAWSFLALYAGSADGGAGRVARLDAPASEDLLDRYVVARTAALVDDVTAALDVVDVAGACEAVREYVDVLTNWYVRRSRARFWGEDPAAMDTLARVLEVVCRVAAPLLPLTTEEVWRGLTGGRSVHLEDWPVPGPREEAGHGLAHDPDLVAAMDRVRAVCSAASSLRKAHGLRTRLPLARLEVVVDDPASLEPFADVVRDEVNVREVVLRSTADAGGGVVERVVVNARAAGPRLGKQVQVALRAAKAGDVEVGDDGSVVAGGIALQEGEYEVQRVVGEQAAGTAAQVLPGRAGWVVLATEVTPELAAEGVARDVVRLVQQARRDAGLAVGTRIRLTVVGDEPVWEAVMAHQGLVMGEVLADSVGAVTFAAARDLGGAAGDLADAAADPAGGVSDGTAGDGARVRVRVEAR